MYYNLRVPKILFILIALFSVIIALFFFNAPTSDVMEIETSIINHKFIPDELKVPAGKKIRLTVYNKDETIEEFESIELKREKIIHGHSHAVIILAPLKPGVYNFFGEFHEDTAQGKLIVEKNEE